MYFAWVRDVGVDLNPIDIAAIQALYGPKTNSSTEKKSSVFCTDLRIDTVFDTPDGSIYAFKGEHYWKVTKAGRAVGSPELISSKWKELFGYIDAAFTYNRKTYFFKGSTCWTYLGDRMLRDPTEIDAIFPGIPNDIDATTVWTGNGDAYFFKGSQYWRYQLRQETYVSTAYLGPMSVWRGLLNRLNAAVLFDASGLGFRIGDGDLKVLSGSKYWIFKLKQKPHVGRGYPKPITDWRGLPGRLDAAVSLDGSTYFFEGQDVYKFDDKTFSVDSEGAQRMSPDFFGCRSG